jgi:hypothetical protein
MFFMQCNDCGQRWEIGTARTCTCPDEKPKREWQGLTDFERLMLDTNYSTLFIERTDLKLDVTYVGKQVDVNGLLTAAEKILKEKNYDKP